MHMYNRLKIGPVLHDGCGHGQATYVATDWCPWNARAVREDLIAIKVKFEHLRRCLFLPKNTPIAQEKLVLAWNLVHDALRSKIRAHSVNEEHAVQCSCL